MKYLNNKDRRRRYFSKDIEVEKVRLKALYNNCNFPITLRLMIMQRIFLTSKYKSNNRINNRCIVTNKSRSVQRDFLLNRSTIREYFSQDLIPGLRKSSW
jgi:small subunit ribosomal protein S14